MLDAACRDIIANELHAAVEPAALAAAKAVRDRHGAAIDAILYYGSCLRDGWREDGMIDFYVLVSSYRAFHDGHLAAAANAVLPPNVFYLETAHGDRTVRLKYAVMSLPAFVRGTSGAAFVPTFWGRFAQPCALAFVRDAAVAATIVDAVTDAVATLIDETRTLPPPPPTSEALWTRAFTETYRCELRAERPERIRALYAANRERYDALTGCAPEPRRPRPARNAGMRWNARRAIGKLLSVPRLLKAVFTFTDGLDYILWKIRRHTGVDVTPTPWQRRHPILAAPLLALRVYRRGGFR